MPANLTPPRALIYTMITTAAVDRNMSDAELGRIGSIVRNLPAFRDFDEEDLIGEAKACGQLLAKDNGLTNVLDMIEASLPENMRETAYALAAEVAASDLKVKAEEIRFMEMLAGRLNLDKLVCAALERAARARHQHA